MKKLITLIILSLSLNGMAQNGFVKAHTVNFEGGLYSRGLAGISYEHNFMRKEWYFLSIHASGGMGFNGLSSSENYYATLAPSFNFGRKTFHFFAGPEVKYVKFGENIFFDKTEGVGAGVFAGVGFYFRTNLCFKIRASVDQIFAENEYGDSFTLPGVGFSIGYSFGKK